MLEIFIPIVIAILIVVIVQVVRGVPWVHRPQKNWLISEGRAYVTRVSMKQDSSGEVHYEPNIKVLYDVNGVTYRQIIRAADFLKCTQHEWENVARYYPSVFTIKVSYDPKNPKNATLEWR